MRSAKKIGLFIAVSIIQINLHSQNAPGASYIADKQQYLPGQNNNGKIKISYEKISNSRGKFSFENTSRDTITLENIVPFGIKKDYVYITGKGDHSLSRTHLFIPGKTPVNVIVPDNAWDLGYCSYSEGNKTIAGLVRRDRTSIKNGTRKRFETILYPGGSVSYLFYKEEVTGDWHAAFKKIFQEKKLYDVEHFNDSLFERSDLKWIRHSYVMHLMCAWNKDFYDYRDNRNHLEEFVIKGQDVYGGDDAIALWPTWPTLGLDQRNQFDLFRDLPGGMQQLKKVAETCREHGTKFFVCYNPWDESTRNENHFEGISELIKQTSADGVVLDTKGESSRELQDAADKVRNGVIMYSEGMAVPKDMQGIVSGRVHNALYYPPMLNLNKFIKPEFSIFRVTEINKERIMRELSLAFFNGYGTEINIMGPGKTPWADEEYKYLGKTTMLLRENTSNFVSSEYTPLIPTTADSIWVNKWIQGNKTIYTVFSLIPQGYNNALFEVQPKQGTHFVDLWNHELIVPGNDNLIPVSIGAFHKKWLGTNNEGAAGCIAQLPTLLNVTLYGDKLNIKTTGTIQGDEIKVWAGDPAYANKAHTFKAGEQSVYLTQLFGRYEGKFVIQLFGKGILLDETIVELKPATPRRISSITKTAVTNNTPAGMVKIPAGQFIFKESHGDEFISYPKQDVDSTFNMPSFFMDKYPVTNRQYKTFIDATGYQPTDTVNYLHNWIDKKEIPRGMEQFPVVYVSYEDAQAYAKWAGKRLPSEIEWQYAAQTSKLNEWPWKQQKPVTRKNETVNETLTVTSIEGIDSTMCNLGNGSLYPVGKYPEGVNPFGLMDLTGCVWQMTNDIYLNGSYEYIIMKGGSYFKPSSSWWYVQSGPRELHYRQFLLRISQGFERNATVGFRCVKD